MISTLAVISGCYLKSIADSMACRWFEIWFTHGEVGDQRALYLIRATSLFRYLVVRQQKLNHL